MVHSDDDELGKAMIGVVFLVVFALGIVLLHV